ncbi:MAG: hypothetical protein Q4A19_04440 [Johnsonella sp.]|nr:hypothetical protein [Johnsonella sp.]
MKKFLGSVILSAALGLSACSSLSTAEFKPNENAIFLKRDASLQSCIIEEAAGEYTSDAFREYVQKEVDDFNRQSAKEAVAIVSAEAEKGSLKLILSYQDIDSMFRFISETQDNTIGVETLQMMKVKDAIELQLGAGLPEEALKKKDAYFAIIEGSNTIYTEGKILFLQGEGAQQLSDHSAQSGSGRNIIIFE